MLFRSLHTPDAQSTVLRVLAMFPPEEQEVVRGRLAESLHAVVSQRLLPKKSGGRAAALEIMVVTPTIRDLILDKDRTGEIRDFIAEGREQYGMQTFDQHLTDLVQHDEVEFEVAIAASTRPSDFELKLKTFRRHSTTTKKVVDLPPEPPKSDPATLGGMDGMSTGFDFLQQG